MATLRLTKEDIIQRIKNKFGDSFILEDFEYCDCDQEIKFLCPTHGWYTTKIIRLLQGKGCKYCAYNKRKKMVHGVGINDLELESTSPVSTIWRHMLQRCYSKAYHKQEPTYIHCEVCDEWKTLSVFKQWFDENYVEGYELDKDLLVKGNKLYSPSTCCFIPKFINRAIKTHKRNNHGLPIGVTKREHSYAIHGTFGNQRLWQNGFSTPEEAFYAYKERKEQYVKVLAEKYFKEGRITERVYRALLDYRVEITD